MTGTAIVLIGGHTHTGARYAPNPEMCAYLERWRKGEPVLPATFMLTLSITLLPTGSDK